MKNKIKLALAVVATGVMFINGAHANIASVDYVDRQILTRAVLQGTGDAGVFAVVDGTGQYVRAPLLPGNIPMTIPNLIEHIQTMINESPAINLDEIRAAISALETLAGTGNLDTVANNFTGAINELRAQIDALDGGLTGDLTDITNAITNITNILGDTVITGTITENISNITNILDGMDTDLTAIENAITDHEGRIVVLEDRTTHTTHGNEAIINRVGTAALNTTANNHADAINEVRGLVVGTLPNIPVACVNAVDGCVLAFRGTTVSWELVSR